MARGGKRPGAGRPKKNREKQGFFEDAESYLRAVVRGETTPDALRVSAARVLIRYQKAEQRAPVKSPSPGQLRKKTETAIERSNIAEFEEKAAAIRAKYAKGDKQCQS